MDKFLAASALFGGISRKMFFWRGILVLLTGVLIALNPVISLELAAKILGVFFALLSGHMLQSLGGMFKVQLEDLVQLLLE